MQPKLLAVSRPPHSRSPLPDSGTPRRQTERSVDVPAAAPVVR